MWTFLFYISPFHLVFFLPRLRLIYCSLSPAVDGYGLTTSSRLFNQSIASSTTLSCILHVFPLQWISNQSETHHKLPALKKYVASCASWNALRSIISPVESCTAISLLSRSTPSRTNPSYQNRTHSTKRSAHLSLLLPVHLNQR